MAEGDAVIYNHFKEQLLVGAINCSGDTFKMILLDSLYTFSADGNLGLADINSREITGSGYTAGGATLAGQTVLQRDSVDNVRFDGNDVAWTNLGTDVIRHAVLYDDTPTTPVADPLCIHWEIATNSNGGNYTLQFGASGILVLS